MTEKDKQNITMEQFNDISKYVEKAQGDKARFLKSKEGLLPHFEFPEGEDKEEKHYSKETLLADMYEEKIERAKEMMENPILIENAYRNLQDNATRGSKKEGEDTNSASWAFRALSALITTHTFSHLSPAKQNEINSYLENSILLENAYRSLQDDATEGSKKEGENAINASYAFLSLSSLATVKDYLREKGKKIDDENFAKEALNPTEKIPPRPETRNNY